MEGPVLPKSLLQLLDDYSVQDKELSWKFHDSKRKISLTLVWTSKSNKALQPPTVPCARRANPGTRNTTRRPRNGLVTGPDKCGPARPHPRTDTPSVKITDTLDKPVNPKSCAAGKKKSPSRLARDRRRLIAFKERKKMERSQKQAENHTTSIYAKSRLIQYRDNPKRIFLTHVPISIPASPNTTASDMKNSIFNSFQERNFYGIHVPNPSCITVVQAVGGTEALDDRTPVWILPDNVPLCHMYADSTIPLLIQFDICIDAPAADDYTSDSDEDWETDSTDSQSVASLD